MKQLSEAEINAIALLSKNQRLMIILVPEEAPSEFVARLTTWSNFCLDTKLLPPLWLPVTRKGDGLVCPYCKMPATRRLEGHGPDCEWSLAAMRWGGAQLQIDEQFGKGPDS